MKLPGFWQWRITLLGALTLAALTLPVSAAQHGLFTYEVIGETIEITDYPEGETGDIVVPSEIDDKPVTSIGDSAFADCAGLISIDLPDSITTIGKAAFFRCSQLRNLAIPAGVTRFEADTFSHCQWLGIRFPPGLTYIGDYAFWNCKGQIRGDIPLGVTSIGPSAFAGVDRMPSVVLPPGLAKISNRAFAHCSSLTTIEIPEGVTRIEDYAFSSCGKLTRVTIPSTVVWIGEYAFGLSPQIDTIIFFGDAPAIGYRIFYRSSFGNPPERTIYTTGGAGYSTTLGGYPVIEGYYPLQHGLFSCKVIGGDSIEIAGYPVDEIGDLVIPAEIDGIPVTSIGAAAFKDCDGLTSIRIPSSVVSIDSRAFYGCSQLVAVVFLGDAPTIGTDVFASSSPEFAVYYTCGARGFGAPGWEIYHPTERRRVGETAIDSIRLIPGGVILTVKNSVHVNDNLSLALAYSPDLSEGSWVELGNFLWIDLCSLEYTDSNSERRARPSGYYRAILRPALP